MATLTQKRLKDVLGYDPYTGIFTWQIRTGRRSHIGDIAGGIDKSTGYWRINIDKKKYHAHRLVWLYMTGAFPNNEIDHINRNRNDNRFVNLRDVTRSENAQNQNGIRSSSGLRGVSWNKRDNCYSAKINANGKQYHLGSFDDKQKACDVYMVAKINMHIETQL